jgi:hypothetical protein
MLCGAVRHNNEMCSSDVMMKRAREVQVDDASRDGARRSEPV